MKVVDDFGIAKNVRLSYNPSNHSWLVIDF